MKPKVRDFPIATSLGCNTIKIDKIAQGIINIKGESRRKEKKILNKVNVLVVDDDEAVRDVLGGVVESVLKYLKRKEFNVDLACDGYKAIERVKEKSFNIIFLDIKMPGIDGVDVFKEIKKISPGSVVIMITGYTEEKLMERARREGPYALLRKPFRSDTIFDIIEKILEDHGKSSG